ncbi:protein Shroom2 isoform X6 [Pleurodeles waltl]|uniref:protein Shroom2 isoform X6 n=1 Tax=Pleurodeles waltl TaxID=8319 RepID=UPI003709923B
MENMETRGSQERFLPDRGPRVSHGYVEQGPLVMVVEHRAADGWRLVEMLLSGGAPWGFTLKGGREHGEPLIITKIEDASKAAGKLLAGDEIISINDVELSGMRQEAICLVKGSHKTLKMIVKRRMKVVLELVAQKMPSESDLHLARSFLSKILRNSMRRNDAAGRPHSWHSTKFTENQSGATLSQLPSTNACSSWHSRYSSSSNQDLSASWDQASLQRTSDHFSSQGSMDSLEHPSQSYQYGRLSSAKSNNSIDHLGNQSKRDSAYGSFSTSSSTPDPMLCKPDAALTETMLYNENLWDPPKYAGNKEGQFLNEGSGTQDRLGYMPPPIQYENSRSPRGDDHSEARISNSGRSNFGPVWYVPEKKKAPSSPPPPPPPIRSDSFAVTKVHEKTNSSSYAEGTSTQHFTHINRPRGGELKSEASDYPQRLGRVNDHGAADVRKNINSTCRYEVNSDHGPATPGDKYNNNILNTNRLQSSLSSTDVRVAQPPLNYHHQRQYSDESTFFHNVRLSGSPKHQPLQHNNVYTNVKEQTTDHLFYNPQVRKPSPSISANIAAEQKMENAGQNRYYSVTTKQTPQGPSQSSQLKNESRKTGANAAQTTVLHNNSDTLAFVEKPKYPLPQQHDNASVESHGTNSLNRAEGYSGISAAGEHFQIPSCTERLDHRKGCEGMVKEIHNNHPCSQQENVKFSVSPADHGAPPHTDLGWGIEENKISPQKTPMLHSLSQENKTRSDSCPETVGDSDTIIDSLLLKQTRRNDRFATTLRNEIQMRRARLQKSKSTAALTESSESEEYPENWKPELPQNVVAPCDKTFTGSYKDHLKEAQARVLQATSFKRRDLEPLPLDHFPASSEFRGQSHSFSVSVLTPEDTPTEMKQNQGGIGSQQVSRIGGRKRFTAEQKLRSYSEPEKMNEVGVSVVHRHHHSRDRSNPSQEALGSFADRWKFFEETSKPAQNKPPQKPTLTSQLEEQPEVPPRKASLHEGERLWHDKRARAASLGFESVLDAHERPNNKISSDKQDFIRKTRNPEQPERLGTFAEYQASWKEQRKPLERRNSGRYHSADNILDVGLEQVEKQPYIHERSRSSPTTDFYAQGSSIDSRGQSDAPRESKEHASGESGSPDAGSASAVRLERVINNVSVKKVPIKIVHSESNAEKESRHNLLSAIEPPALPPRLEKDQIKTLSTSEQSYSRFCAYTRQDPEAEVHRQLRIIDSEQGDVSRNNFKDSSVSSSAMTYVMTKEKTLEDIKTEELAREIVVRDKSLADILDPNVKMRTTMDLMMGIFPKDDNLLEEAQQRRKFLPKVPSPKPAEDKKDEQGVTSAISLTTSSAYYSTSAPKAELLIKMKDMQQQQLQDQQQQPQEDSEEELDHNLSEKKQELIDSISKKLQVLRDARETLLEDIQANNCLGDEVEAIVQEVCKPNEFDKFRMFIGDLDKVVNLLLSLSGRLARVENALNNLDENASPEERRTLVEKQKLLTRQHEDAKELKENLDRRERIVFDILASYLSDESLADYEHFVKMKSALIIEQRELEDKIKLGEEQLKCLTESLPFDRIK